MLTYEKALARILAEAKPLSSESIAIDDALGRVLAEDIVAATAVPPFRNSSMDGFALRFADLTGAPLTVVGTVRAGDLGDVRIDAGQAVRIMTGAIVPVDADTVVPIEDCTVEGSLLSISEAVRNGQCIRPAGQDVPGGAKALHRGQVMTPAAIGMAAVVGRAAIAVHQKPRVGIVATGDELVDPGAGLRPGQIYNSNAYAIAAQCRDAGVDVACVLRAGDDRDELRAAFDACAGCDVIITSGGVSVGEFDYVKEVFAERGTIDFWQVAVRPGKPLAYGRWGETVFFGLPGNPASSLITFELFVRPMLRRMLGYSDVLRPIVQARLTEPIRHDPGRRSFLRARVQPGDGGFTTHLSGGQDSGMLHALVDANGLIVLPEDVDEMHAGSMVDVILF